MMDARSNCEYVVTDEGALEGRVPDGGLGFFRCSPSETWAIAQAIDEGRCRLVEPLSDEFLSNCGGRVIAKVRGGCVEFIGGAMFGRRRLADLDAWIARHRAAGNIQ